MKLKATLIRMPAELHKLAKLRVCQLDKSFQEWIIELITKELNNGL